MDGKEDGMDKLEKVISNLAILRTWCAVNPNYGIGLSVNDCQKVVAWLDDALELLKAQEPRVMTVDEINQLSNGETVWVEISDGRLLPMMVEDGTLMRWGYMWRICDEAFCTHEEGECAARAWTSRPTDEQREATPWIKEH